MTEAVVDRLEVIKIKHQDGDRFALSAWVSISRCAASW
jgi:hypothetical protein